MNTLQALLKKIAAIKTMERGTLCPMQSGRYYNHQTWVKGRNVVRYVPKSEVRELRKAIAGYRRFLELTQQYADCVIQTTRDQRKSASTPRHSKPNQQKKKK